MNNRPKIIEMVGLAGAGKSTLVKSMRQRNEEIRVSPPPSKISLLPFLIKRSTIWLPLCRKTDGPIRQFGLGDLWTMGCLDVWLPNLRSQAVAKAGISVLDPGSVYWLTSLQAFGSQSTEHSLYQRWWDLKLEQWSLALDVIIWLDAPEELCLNRILARDEWHIAKLKMPQEVLERFRDLRKGYERIISRMVSLQPKKVFSFRTDQISTREMVDQIFSEVDLAPAGPGSGRRD